VHGNTRGPKMIDKCAVIAIEDRRNVIAVAVAQIAQLFKHPNGTFGGRRNVANPKSSFRHRTVNHFPKLGIHTRRRSRHNLDYGHHARRFRFSATIAEFTVLGSALPHNPTRLLSRLVGFMRIAVIGAGGHAKVVADAVLAAGSRVVGFFDDDPSLQGDTRLGHPILGLTDAWQSAAASHFVIGIGDNLRRRQQFDKLNRGGAKFATVVHPMATIGKGVTLGPGTVILANVVVNCDTQIGPNSILNTSCTVDHDCVVGAHCHIAPGCNLAGGVRLGEGAFVGIGTKMIPGVCVGDWAIVGAGSVVIRDVKDAGKVAGVPARYL
jgi:sugar O-acyltransferase (sialic acid O-acetyltransferase NeuD family)